MSCCCWRHGGKVCPHWLVFRIVQGCNGVTCCIKDVTLPTVSRLVSEVCMIRAQSLSVDGVREVISSAAVVVTLLRLLLRVPVAVLRTRWPRELDCCVRLGSPSWPSRCGAEVSRRLESVGSKLPVRLRLVIGSCSLSV